MNPLRIASPTTICPYCKSPLIHTTNLATCSNCQTLYHRECWLTNGRCSIFGCSGTSSVVSRNRIRPSNVFKSILRYILILPAAFGAALASNLATAIYYYLAGIFGHQEPVFWIELVNSGLAGYYFVYGGTKTAPAHRKIVAIVVTVVYFIWEALVVNATVRHGKENVLWFSITTIVTLAAAIYACVKLQDE